MNSRKQKEIHYHPETLTQDKEQTKSEGLNTREDKGLNEEQVSLVDMVTQVTMETKEMTMETGTKSQELKPEKKTK